MDDSLTTVEEVAKYLKVEESTVYTWAKKGKLPGMKVGRFWRFKKEDINEWLEEKRKKEFS